MSRSDKDQVRGELQEAVMKNRILDKDTGMKILKRIASINMKIDKVLSYGDPNLFNMVLNSIRMYVMFKDKQYRIFEMLRRLELELLEVIDNYLEHIIKTRIEGDMDD